jgi:hypothetical protein
VNTKDGDSFPHLPEKCLKKPFEKYDGAQDLDDDDLGVQDEVLEWERRYLNDARGDGRAPANALRALSRAQGSAVVCVT